VSVRRSPSELLLNWHREGKSLARELQGRRGEVLGSQNLHAQETRIHRFPALPLPPWRERRLSCKATAYVRHRYCFSMAVALTHTTRLTVRVIKLASAFPIFSISRFYLCAPESYCALRPHPPKLFSLATSRFSTCFIFRAFSNLQICPDLSRQKVLTFHIVLSEYFS
jgi:hypothetical protein